MSFAMAAHEFVVTITSQEVRIIFTLLYTLGA
jgi:hypothetical protein